MAQAPEFAQALAAAWHAGFLLGAISGGVGLYIAATAWRWWSERA